MLFVRLITRKKLADAFGIKCRLTAIVEGNNGAKRKTDINEGDKL